jgi:catechol 2,3-dioxygenase-like lactoylglutathione lyase family enzyme
MTILGIDHVQVAIPAGGEAQARAFYGGLLGLPEVAKPEALAARGGCWFEAGTQQVHCGVEPVIADTRRHPGLLVDDLDALGRALADAGHPVTPDGGIPGVRRFHSVDPFGNRLEFVQRIHEDSRQLPREGVI